MSIISMMLMFLFCAILIYFLLLVIQATTLAGAREEGVASGIKKRDIFYKRTVVSAEQNISKEQKKDK
jgi:hypothetical protein